MSVGHDTFVALVHTAAVLRLGLRRGPLPRVTNDRVSLAVSCTIAHVVTRP